MEPVSSVPPEQGQAAPGDEQSKQRRQPPPADTTTDRPSAEALNEDDGKYPQHQVDSLA
jgi:hypothetical protein